MKFSGDPYYKPLVWFMMDVVYRTTHVAYPSCLTTVNSLHVNTLCEMFECWHIYFKQENQSIKQMHKGLTYSWCFICMVFNIHHSLH